MVPSPEPGTPSRATGRCKAGLAGLVVVALTLPTPFASAAFAAEPPAPRAALARVLSSAVQAPDAPTLVGAAPADGAAKLTFRAPLSDGGDSALSYEASVDAGVSWTPLTTRVVGGLLLATLPGLDDFQTYDVVVHAVNSAGAGTASNLLSVTPAQAPGTPTVASWIGTNGKVTFQFALPSSDGGNEILGYQYSVDGGRTWPSLAVADITADPATAVVTGLTNETPYGFRMRAVNAIGTSVPTRLVQVIPHAVAPDAPTGLSVAPDNGRAHLSFSTPASDGGRPVTGYEYSLDGTNWSALTTSGTGTVTADVTGLSNGVTYGVRVRALNSVGSSTATAPQSVTPAPVAPDVPAVALSQHDGEVDVDVTAPAYDGGSAVSGYDVEITDTTAQGPAQVHPQTASGSPSHYAYTGLVDGDTYSVRVRAVNGAGHGAWSAAQTEVPVGAPDAPVLVSVTPRDSALRVAFDLPHTNGGTVDSYRFHVLDHDGTDVPVTATPSQIVADTQHVHYDVTGLTNGEPYTVWVEAHDTVGWGSASATSSAVTPSTVPAAPVLGALSTGDGTLTVPFTAPSSTGGSAITGYAATVTDLTAGTAAATVSFGLADVQGGGSPYVTLTGLHNGHRYAVQLQALNGSAVGISALSNQRTGTPSTTAAAPAAPSVSSRDQAVVVSFDAPDDGGNAIGSYRIAWTGGSTGSATVLASDLVLAGGHLTTTVSGLSNGSAYTFTVLATNDNGDGAASPASGSVTPAGAPGGATGLGLTPGDASFDLSLTAPSDGGSGLTQYDVRLTDGRTGSVDHRLFDDAALLASATPVLHVDDLVNGDAYTVEVRADNGSYGVHGTWVNAGTVTPATVPGAPSVTDVTPGNGTADVTFSVPDSGGDAISGYTVVVRSGGSVVNGLTLGSVTTVDAGHRAVHVSGLVDGTSYTVTVAATNGVGTGADSAASSAFVPFTVPDAPASVVVSSHDARTATLTLTAPAFDGGRPVTGYALQINGGTASPLTVTSTNGTLTAVVTGLTPATSYTFTVAATNDAGTGPGRAASPVTEYAVVPDAPTGLSAARGNGSATLSFTAPAYDGGSGITGYEYTLDGTAWQPVPQGRTISGLTNGTHYTVAVRALNAMGAGAASVATGVTPATTPLPPALLSTTSDNGKAHLLFTRPASDGGDPVTGFQASTDGVSWVDLTATAGPYGGSFVADLPGLTNGTTYAVSLRSVNGVGWSAPSSPLSVTPAPVAPTAPTGLTATSGNHTAHLSFTVPSDNGGSTIDHYQVSIDGGGWTTFAVQSSGSTRTADIGALDNDRAYTVAVRAVNGAGESPASVPASVTPAPVAATAPQVVSTAAGNGTATLTFTAPGDDGGLPVAGYQVAVDGGDFADVVTTGTGPFSATVSGLTNGTTYALRVRAVNPRFAGAASAPQSVSPHTVDPTAPVGLTATSGDRRAVLHFSPPASDGGSPVTGYEYRLDGGTWQALTVTGTGDQLTATVSSLVEEQTYAVEVHALTLGHVGASASTSVTPHAVVPGAPGVVHVVSGDGVAHLTFTAVTDDGGSPVRGYQVKVGTRDWALLPTDGADPLTADLFGLTDGTTYDVSVRAYNGVGAGAATVAVQALPHAVPADAPTDLQVTGGNGTLHLSFVAPQYLGGSALASYQVSVDGADWARLDVTPAAGRLTADLDGLTNGRPYAVAVRAATVAVPEGTATAAVTTAPHAVAPSAPTGLMATGGNGSASLIFSVPEDLGGNSSVSYQIKVDDADWAPLTVDLSGSVATATWHGLDNGSSYALQVRAVAPGGDSDPTEVVDVTPAPVLATAPRLVDLEPARGSAHLVFLAPADNGGDEVEGYRVQVDGGGWGDLLTPVADSDGLYALDLPGLANGMDHTVSVLAVTAVGDGAATETETVTLPVLPATAPQGLSAEAGNGSATLTFSAPADSGGSDVAGYEYSVDGGDSWSPLQVSGDGELSATVTGLTNGRQYSVEVRALTLLSVEAGATSEVGVAPHPVAPSAPRALQVTPRDSSASLSFAAPQDAGGNEELSYEVTVDGGAHWAPLDVTQVDDVLTATLGDLVNGTAYSVQVRAGADDRFGDPTAVELVTPATVPGAPGSLTARAGDSVLHLSFAAPVSDGGSQVTGYEASLDGTTWTGLEVTSGDLLTADLPVANGATYVVRVRAVNDAGTGAVTTAAPVAVPVVAPAAPTALTATPKDGALALQWTAPSAPAGDPLSYQVRVAGTLVQVRTAVSGSTVSATLTGLTNGTTYAVSVTAVGQGGSSPAATVSGRPSAIAAQYATLGGAGSFLGAPTGPETAVAGGYAQAFVGGSLFWSATTGVHEVHGAIRDHYLALGGPAGVLGFPTSDEQRAPDGTGRFGTFAGTGAATIAWSPATGAYAVLGAVHAKWQALGGLARVGYPTTDETAAAVGGGRYNRFTTGTTVYWAPSTGAVAVGGAIHALWAASGYERGPLGAPTTDELVASDGVGRISRFTGSAVYWTPGTGAHMVVGAIYARYLALGAERSPLSYPTTDELAGPAGSRVSEFRGGSIYWTPATGAWSVRGAIRDRWLALGGAGGRLGAPTSDEYGVPGGRRSDFAHGSVTWVAATGALQVVFR